MQLQKDPETITTEQWVQVYFCTPLSLPSEAI